MAGIQGDWGVCLYVYCGFTATSWPTGKAHVWGSGGGETTFNEMLTLSRLPGVLGDIRSKTLHV